MTFIKFEPLKELELLHDNLQRYFEDFSNTSQNFNENYLPNLDLAEDNEFVYVEVELPGMKKEDIKITLEDNILTLEGEKKSNYSEKLTPHNMERCFGSFKRSFSLPVEVDRDKISAEFSDGVLSIKFKKSEKHIIKEKEISIN